MSVLRPVDGSGCRYSRLIATGGIGHGMLFLLEGGRTLGRNESRTGRLQKARDYCKLHITCHYASVLLRSAEDPAFEVIPIGRVGNDAAGAGLVDEMRRVGMSMEDVAVLDGCDTLFSVCLQYPDRSGGNITTADSASDRITPADVEAACARRPRGEARELFLAVPEAPLDARVRLLQIGRERSGFTAAAVLAMEAESFTRLGGFSCTDLLAVNIDEARAIARLGDEPLPGDQVARACAEAVGRRAPQMMLAVTDERNGSYGFHGGCMRHYPGLGVEAVSTGGAGDAFLSGILVGLCCGLPFMGEGYDGRLPSVPLECALDLGTAVAAMSVTSPDSIHAGIDARTLLRFIQDGGLPMAQSFRRMFAD